MKCPKFWGIFNLQQLIFILKFAFLIKHYMTSILLFIGGPEIVIIMLVVVMLFGSKKIPEIARGLGKGMRELKDASNEIKREIRSSATSVKEEIQKVEKDLEK